MDKAAFTDINAGVVGRAATAKHYQVAGAQAFAGNRLAPLVQLGYGARRRAASTVLVDVANQAAKPMA